MSNRYDSILDTIGNTPVVRINNIGPKNVNIFVKAESFNPLGSVKDRLALGVIEDAEESGELKPGQTVIEATSGNTGIGLAMVCAQKGYPLVVIMGENFSIERRRILRFLGAQVVLTPAAAMGSGMLKKVNELCEKNGWWQSLQFENPANANIHARTTAVEILDDFDDIKLDYWVSGFGTGGTINGVSRVLKVKSPYTKIIVCEPDNSQILGSGIPQPRNADGSPSDSHPNSRPHLMQGWSPNFIPKLAEEVIAASNIDAFLPIDGNFAIQCAKDLAQKEGIFVGTSSGATFAGALKIAESAPDGSNSLCMLPDTGERYLSTPLFDDIPADMTADEFEISRSTPGARFDAPPPAEPDKTATEEEEPEIEAPADAVKFLNDTVSDPDEPVVLFALEWCEFCWSLRKMFAKYEIPYRSVDLDSVAYQEDNKGGKIRAALRERTGSKTIPQVFVGGQFIGGATELFDSQKGGELAELLEKNSVIYNKDIDVDPYTFLPGWLQQR